jgi:hypothetical protein
MEDLLIRKLFNGVEKAVARVVDDEIDLAEIGEGLFHDLMESRHIRQVDMGELGQC